MSEQGGTPRTDAVTVKILSSLQSGTEDVVYADFARTLEREAATLREQIAFSDRDRAHLVKNARRLWIISTLFQLELEKLLRSHLGIAGGSIETLCDAALAAIEQAKGVGHE